MGDQLASTALEDLPAMTPARIAFTNRVGAWSAQTREQPAASGAATAHLELIGSVPATLEGAFAVKLSFSSKHEGALEHPLAIRIAVWRPPTGEKGALLVLSPAAGELVAPTSEKGNRVLRITELGNTHYSIFYENGLLHIFAAERTRLVCTEQAVTCKLLGPSFHPAVFWRASLERGSLRELRGFLLAAFGDAAQRMYLGNFRRMHPGVDMKTLVPRPLPALVPGELDLPTVLERGSCGHGVSVSDVRSEVMAQAMANPNDTLIGLALTAHPPGEPFVMKTFADRLTKDGFDGQHLVDMSAKQCADRVSSMKSQRARAAEREKERARHAAVLQEAVQPRPRRPR
jgi:hypothetical protein